MRRPLDLVATLCPGPLFGDGLVGRRPRGRLLSAADRGGR